MRLPNVFVFRKNSERTVPIRIHILPENPRFIWFSIWRIVFFFVCYIYEAFIFHIFNDAEQIKILKFIHSKFSIMFLLSVRYRQVFLLFSRTKLFHSCIITNESNEMMDTLWTRWEKRFLAFLFYPLFWIKKQLQFLY